MELHKRRKNYRTGMICALACATLWGFLPIYWHSLRPIDSSVIIFYRVFLVGVVCFLAALRLYGWSQMKYYLGSPRQAVRFILAGILITANWSIYIWAVNADQVIQTCIGYYIEPLMVCVFGIVIFKEKLTGYKGIALILALAGVVMVLVHFWQVPLIALSLAFTFAIYAAMKKSLQAPAILSLLYETMLLSPLALIVILYLEFTGQGALNVGQPYQYGLLLLAGIVTATPLALFAVAAGRIPLVSLGVTEYISPSISLIVGVFLFREPFDSVQFLAFAVIWVGLVFFTVGEIRAGEGPAVEKSTEDPIRAELQEGKDSMAEQEDKIDV